MAKFLNITGYRFFSIDNTAQIQNLLKEKCNQLQLKGSIILGQEGINFSIAGLAENISLLQNYLYQDLKVPEIDYKESWSDNLPFQRMKVKVKEEIITMKELDIDPNEFTGPHLSPSEFKKWLDEKRDIVVLDTRNDYEVTVGKFSQAVDLKVKNFTEFAVKAEELPQDYRNKPLVMYCTGGIRCEKASALFIKKYGFKDVYQLDGGILSYFKECGDDHYEGKCFVFDERQTIDDKDLIS